MVTNKAFTIRLGQTQPWASSITAQNWYQYHFNLRIKAFFEKFFGDKFFQNRGVSFSHVIPKFFHSHIGLEVFIHDSKLYDFFGTKPVRRALKLIKSKKKLKTLLKKITKFKAFVRKKQKSKNTKFRFAIIKKDKQSRFLVSTTSLPYSRKKVFSFSSNLRRCSSYAPSNKQTLESKFKKNKFFRLRFKSVRKFVKLSRKLRKRFDKNRLKLFKPVKLRKSNRSFSNSKLNFILNRRKYLSSTFITRKRFKKRYFKKKNYKKRFHRPRRNFRFKRLFFKKKQFRKKKSVTRQGVKKKYSKRLIKISRRFSSRFSFKLKIAKIKFLRFYFRTVKNSNSESAKLASSLKSYYFRKKYAIFNNLRNRKILSSKKLRKSKLGKRFFRLYSFGSKIQFNKIGPVSKKRLASKLIKPTFSKFNFVRPSKNRGPFSKQKTLYTPFGKKVKNLRYPSWRVRYLPITETSRKAARFVFFNPLSAYSANRFIRYSFYHFLAKFLSSQVFRQFNVPVFIKFNFFPLHRAGSDFYLNFITTKLYYRYILSDVIKPIVRISLKFYRGFVINCNGRFTRAQIAVSKKFVRKSVSYSKITSSLDYAQRSVVLKYGTCNLRIWIRK
jgi:hypothetical protein